MYYRGFEIQNIASYRDQFPFSLGIFDAISSFSFDKPITIFVGENGSGKSTLLKSLALSMNLPAIASENLENDTTLADLQLFADNLRGKWAKKTYQGFFFRAEDYFGFAKRLNNMDQDFNEDIVDFEKKLSGTGLKLAVGAIHGQKEALLRKYGDLHRVSHGEGFLRVLQNRIQPEGIYLIDEPEAALSPQRQLSLYSLIKDMATHHNCQFIIATHSPILMTLPNSQLFEFGETIEEKKYADTEHYTIMKQFLNDPELFTRHL
jgi:predicted ATPase